MDSPQRHGFDVVRLTITIAVVGLLFSIVISVLGSMRSTNTSRSSATVTTASSAAAMSVDSATK